MIRACFRMLNLRIEFRKVYSEEGDKVEGKTGRNFNRLEKRGKFF